MKCDGKHDTCLNEATRFEVMYASSTYYYKWCEECYRSVNVRAVFKHEDLSEEEYLVQQVMAA
jgi:hypothetical protein